MSSTLSHSFRGNFLNAATLHKVVLCIIIDDGETFEGLASKTVNLNIVPIWYFNFRFRISVHFWLQLLTDFHNESLFTQSTHALHKNGKCAQAQMFKKKDLHAAVTLFLLLVYVMRFTDVRTCEWKRVHVCENARCHFRWLDLQMDGNVCVEETIQYIVSVYTICKVREYRG